MQATASNAGDVSVGQILDFAILLIRRRFDDLRLGLVRLHFE